MHTGRSKDTSPAKILLEGRRGIGKTTAVWRIEVLLEEDGVRLAGFLTRELPEGGRRVGFTIETFDGGRATLAHVDFPGPPRVSKYGVDVEAFERLAIPALGASYRDSRRRGPLITN